MKKAAHISRFSTFMASMAIISLFWATCAKPISPTGGPRDEVPPKVSKTVPENQSLNFTGKEIRIFFDEAVRAPAFDKEIFISP
ncbi:MAG: Ig-like domain-containing protein, partial [Bacteroidota bacterium]